MGEPNGLQKTVVQEEKGLLGVDTANIFWTYIGLEEAL